MADPKTSRRRFEETSKRKLIGKSLSHSSDTDLGVFADAEQIDTEPAQPVSSAVGVLQFGQICFNEEQCFPELAFVLGYTGDPKEPTLTVTQCYYFTLP